MSTWRARSPRLCWPMQNDSWDWQPEILPAEVLAAKLPQ